MRIQRVRRWRSPSRSPAYAPLGSLSGSRSANEYSQKRKKTRGTWRTSPSLAGPIGGLTGPPAGDSKPDIVLGLDSWSCHHPLPWVECAWMGMVANTSHSGSLSPTGATISSFPISSSRFTFQSSLLCGLVCNLFLKYISPTRVHCFWV